MSMTHRTRDCNPGIPAVFSIPKSRDQASPSPGIEKTVVTNIQLSNWLKSHHKLSYFVMFINLSLIW